MAEVQEVTDLVDPEPMFSVNDLIIGAILMKLNKQTNTITSKVNTYALHKRLLSSMYVQISYL